MSSFLFRISARLAPHEIQKDYKLKLLENWECQIKAIEITTISYRFPLSTD